MKLAISVAMDIERAQIEALLSDARPMDIGTVHGTCGRLGAAEVLLVESGIGKTNAAIAATEVLRGWAPDALLSTGVAGGIAPGLAVMDVVVATETFYHDVWCGEPNQPGQVQGLPPRFASDKKLLSAARAVAADGGAFRFGPIATGDCFITSRVEQNALHTTFPDALAVDMESAALAHVCLRFGVPFLSFRILSDTPGATENHAAQYKDFWATLADKSFQATSKLLQRLAQG